MQTLTLKIEDSISERFFWFLEHFSSDELEIVNSTYQKNKEFISDLTQEQSYILQERLEEFHNNTNNTIPWDKFKNEF